MDFIKINLAAIVLVLFQASPVFSESLVIIVNEDSPIFSIKKNPGLEELKEVCLGKARFWGSDPVKLVNQKDRTMLESFVNATCGMKLSEYQHYWTKKMLNEGVRAPLSVASSNEVIRHVRKEKGGIGYILKSEAAKMSGIKAIYEFSPAP